MRKVKAILFLLTAAALALMAADWPMQNGGPERNGWARSEHILTKADIAHLTLLYAYRANAERLSAPIVNGNLITYVGFKEMLIFSSGADRVYSVDADLNKLIWQSHLPYRSEKAQRTTSTASCPAGSSAPVAMAGSSSASMHFAAVAARMPAVPGKPVKRPSPYFPPLWQSVYPMRPETLSQLSVIYTVSSDGYLHVLNSSTGGDLIAPFQFVPPNARVSSLNVSNNMIYVTTTGNCDGYRNALYAVNLLSNEKHVLVFSIEGEFAGSAGTAIGRDGTVYVQTTQAIPNKADRFRDVLYELTPRELNVKDSFSPPKEQLRSGDLNGSGITPIVFSWMGKELLAAASRDGRLFLLDAKSLGGGDHQTPLSALAIESGQKRKRGTITLHGTFSTWQNVDTQQRWIYAPAENGIRAFQLAADDKLTPLWTSEALVKPTSVIIASGMIFTATTGTPAELYALDALTGKKLHASDPLEGTLDGAPALANGRIYLSTHGNKVYCFGLRAANLQLTEQGQ